MFGGFKLRRAPRKPKDDARGSMYTAGGGIKLVEKDPYQSRRLLRMDRIQV